MTSVWSSFVQQYFGLPAASASEPWTWRWTIGWPTAWAVPLSLVGMLFCLGALVWSARRLSAKIRPRQILLLSVLRFLVAAGLLVTALQVALVATSATPASVALVFDTSRSMSLGDSYSPEELRALAPYWTSPRPPTRWALLQSLFNPQDSDLELFLSRRPIETWRLAGELNPLSATAAGAPPRTPAELREALSAVPPDGSRTNYFDSFEQLWSAPRPSQPAAIVLFTDGNATSGPPASLLAVAQRALQLQTPLSIVGLGSTRSLGDLRLDAVHFDRVQFPQTRVPLTVLVSALDVLRATSEVRLLSLPDRTVIDTASLAVSQQSPVHVTLRTPPLGPGRHNFEVAVAPIPGERDLANNARRLSVIVRETQLRVLLIDQSPRWEHRHLKSVLERDQDCELQTLLLDADPDHQIEDRSARSGWPTNLEELSQLDVVILGDVAPDRIPAGFERALPEFLSEGGGGFILIAGKRLFSSGGPPDRWATLLPADGGSDWNSGAGARLEVRVEAGRPLYDVFHTQSGELRTLPDVALRRWPATPRVTAERLLQFAPESPLLLAQRFGRGVAVWQLFDDSWRWRPVDNGELHRRYWSQLVRYAGRQRMLQQLPAWELSLDQDAPTQLDSLVLRLESSSGESPSAETTVRVLGTDFQSEIPLLDGGGDASVRTGRLPPLAPGHYTAQLLRPLLDTPPDPLTWEVQQLDPELLYQPLNRRELTQAAQRSGGRYYSPGEVAQLWRDPPLAAAPTPAQAVVIPLWNRWEILLLLAGVCVLEWTLRRSWGVS